MATNDPAEREHRLAVARWLQRFLDPHTGIEAELRDAHSLNLEAARTRKHPQPAERPYMEQDSSKSLSELKVN